MMISETDNSSGGFFARVFGLKKTESAPVLAALLMFFVFFCAYSMMRPVRETMGVAGGVENLQWLFSGTFIATLLAMPVFGWLASRVSRRRILPWVYGFFILNLLGFSIALFVDPHAVWTGRVFYVWLSVFNLMAVSLAWSVMADIFSSEQAKRLFALIAAGASLGGLFGPALGSLLVPFIGHSGLLTVSALLLCVSAALIMWLHRWRDRNPLSSSDGDARDRQRPLGGNPFAGITEVLRSPFLAGIALFMILLACLSSFLYFEQARLVSELFPDPVRQTQVFGGIDTAVQALTVILQLFVTGKLARRFGTGVLLTVVPLIVAVGFLCFALSPVFAVFVVVMVLRRAGEYGVMKPGREMLFTLLNPEEKYKAKNFIDTVVYRGGDSLGAWAKHGLDAMGGHSSIPMLIAAGLALVWAGVGYALGKKHTAISQGKSRLT